MKTVGLTGGIGAGKSSVARRLAAYGAYVIDMDALAREVVQPGTPGFSRVVAHFGPRVVAEDGSLDRAALATEVFHDDVARAHLEAIVHPLVAARAAELTSQAAPDAVVVHEVPLLVEIGWQPLYDVVVVVTAQPAIAVARIVAARGISVDDAWARVNAQASDEQRTAAAHFVIDNSGTEADLDAAVAELWGALRMQGTQAS